MHEAACVRRRQRPCDLLQRTAKHGEGAAADYVDTYDLFHTMEAYFTWYPKGAPA